MAECCIFDCEKEILAKELCSKHYTRLRNHNDTSTTLRDRSTPPEIPSYKQLRINGKPIVEHRYLMERHLGRKLKSNEIVHHKDGDRFNNAIDNLEIVDRAKHASIHHLVGFIIGNYKICTKCDKVLPLTRFSKSTNPTGIRSDCKTCQNIQNKKRLLSKAEVSH